MYLLKAGTTGPLAVDRSDPDGSGPWYELSQNYPNPFNASTRIEFNLPRRSSYTLTVYNILGQLVRQWGESDMPPGWYSLFWDRRDPAGVSVASGVYIYRLIASDFIETKKMILLK